MDLEGVRAANSKRCLVILLNFLDVLQRKRMNRVLQEIQMESIDKQKGNCSMARAYVHQNRYVPACNCVKDLSKIRDFVRLKGIFSYFHGR